MFTTLVYSACSSDEQPPRYQEMVAYHAESQHLTVATADSVSSFARKVGSFVTLHPAAKQAPLYPEIKQNIQQNMLRLKITITDEWLGEYYMEF